MRVIGVDVGKNSPAHVMCIDLHHTWDTEPITTYDACPVFVEGQFPRHKSSRQSLMTLSYFAGLVAGCYMSMGHPVYILKPEKWKPLIVHRSATMNKQVMQNRARIAGLVPDEIWKQNEDVIDAYLIAQAGLKLIRANKLPKAETWTR